MYTNDIVLGDGLVNTKLEQWREELESRDFELSRSKMECIKCNFSTFEITIL